MAYLLLYVEYFMTETEKYDIKWTIPHCVLTLRLIGQAFDVYDGTKKDVRIRHSTDNLFIHSVI